MACDGIGYQVSGVGNYVGLSPSIRDGLPCVLSVCLARRMSNRLGCAPQRCGTLVSLAAHRADATIREDRCPVRRDRRVVAEIGRMLAAGPSVLRCMAARRTERLLGELVNQPQVDVALDLMSAIFRNTFVRGSSLL